MRRREKFVISSIVLSLALLGVQYVDVALRFLAVSLFTFGTYLISAWALRDDLQRHEWATIVPLPALYAAAVGMFYFLLPSNIWSRGLILVLFGIGMYALYLTTNIFSVAKGRTIQLLHAAHAIAALFTLIISLLFLNTIFSLRLGAGWNALLVAITHAPLIILSMWSINLENKVNKEVLTLGGILTLLVVELAFVLSFLPMPIWHVSLFIMSFVYLGLGVLHSYLKDRLFTSALQEYSLLAFSLAVVFVILFPLK